MSFPDDENDIDLSEENTSAPLSDDAEGHDGYRTLAHGVLSPRHRRFAQLVASGAPSSQITEELGYVASRISVLKKNPYVAEEVARLQERIFEETIGSRLKGMADQALTNISTILHDKTGRVKTSEKMALSQWLIEKLDGKAAQKIEAGENLLAVLMDRLDAAKTRPIVHNHLHIEGSSVHKDVTPSGPSDQPQLSAPKSEEDLLADWAENFDAV